MTEYNKNTSILTVAIPTYNRPETLEPTLKLLSKEDLHTFNILISDDSSNDEVAKLVQNYQQSMPNLRYSKNLDNLGYSRNVAKLYELAETRYVWFVCDDDSIMLGAIQDVIAAIKKYEPVVAIFNSTWVDPYGRKKTAGVSEDCVYTDIESFNRYDVLMRLTFLSIIILEKSIPIDSISNNSECKDNVFVQLTIALQLLSNKFKLCEVSATVLYRNVGFKYGEFYKFILLDPLKAVHLIPHKFENRKFIKNLIKELPTALQLYLSQKIGLYSYLGNPTIKTLKNIFKFYGPYGVPIVILRVLCNCIPKKIIRGAYLIRLIQIHGGIKEGLNIYRQFIDRAIIDTRKTGFTNYR